MTIVLKLKFYADAGAHEYWIVDPHRERIFFLETSYR